MYLKCLKIQLQYENFLSKFEKFLLEIRISQKSRFQGYYYVVLNIPIRSIPDEKETFRMSDINALMSCQRPATHVPFLFHIYTECHREARPCLLEVELLKAFQQAYKKTFLEGSPENEKK